MPALAWLVVAGVAGVSAYLMGWPAWQSYRAREARDMNTERYLAWRGRADRTSGHSTSEGMTGEERRRIYVGVALAIMGVLALIAFFVTS
jgi:hypothetical protein